MGLLFNRRDRRPADERYWGISQPSDLVPRRMAGPSGVPYINKDGAKRISAAWAAIRLRADLISTMPLKSYRFNKDGFKVEVPLSPMMADPGFLEWRYSSQVELDSTGNSIGIIHSKDGNGLPREVELASTDNVSLLYREGKLARYRICGVEYPPEWVWHEKQYTVSGLDVGLSPVAYAAYTLGQYRSVQEFAVQWFLAGNGPRASLKNTEKKLNPKETAVVKEAWRASQSLGEPFVHGTDWEYNLVEAQQASADWIQAQQVSNVDISRFFGVPADLIDAAVSGSSITYANVSQRNLQFMIMNLSPAIVRRESAYSAMLPRPRFVEIDADKALLRMDPQTKANVTSTLIQARAIAPSEARADMNREPYTAEQIKEFEILGLNKTATGALTGAEGLPVPSGTQEAPLPAEDNTEGQNNG
jgi:HK97 family phage portal protein